MVVVAERDKAKRLKHASRRLSQGVEHLCHSMHVAGLRLNGHFDKIAFGERPLELQEPASQRKRLDFGSGPLAVAQFNQRGCGL